MITVNSAKTLDVEGEYGIEIGKPADLIILDAENEMEAIRLVSECHYVIRKGKVVCSTRPASRTLKTNGIEEQIDFKL